MKSTRREGFDAVLAGKDVTIEFERVTTYSKEMYGADADGNRGMLIDTIDDDEATGITVTSFTSNGDGLHEVAVPFTELDEERRVLVKAAIDHYLETTEPTPQDEKEDDNDEPDDLDDYWDEEDFDEDEEDFDE